MGVSWGCPPRLSLFAVLFARLRPAHERGPARQVPARVAASTARRDLATISARRRALVALDRANRSVNRDTPVPPSA